MKTKNIDALVGATLYIKTKLLLYGFKDLSIKDMLSQAGLNVDKPFKLSFDIDNGIFCGWLRYEAEDENISFKFDKVVLKNDNKKSLVLDVIKGVDWIRYLISKPKIGRTRLAKLKREINKSINLGTEESEILLIEETIDRGFVGPARILLKISKRSIDSRDKTERIIEIINFDFSNWQEYALCDIKLDSHKQILELINRIKNIKDVNIVDIYQEICDIYGLDLGKLKNKFHVNFKFIDENNSNSYFLEEKYDAIEVRENGKLSRYSRDKKHSGIRKYRSRKSKG